MNEAERWVEFGSYLRQQRDNAGLSRREAARRSKVPESVWKDLETGQKTAYGGVRVLPNPTPDVLAKMATVLELSPEELTRHVGRFSSKPKSNSSAGSRDGVSALTAKISRLNDRDRQLVESLVDQMLEPE
ncbi:MAG: helix-turn-helix domain-containing protein [Actinobacteria bacterium]|nr:MAG: helix-turn-helix domain-containing protein [Actinomycetota bacterium]